ncbi:hypothetical protein ACFQZ8_14555, partial [Micromonospora azadirachtae]
PVCAAIGLAMLLVGRSTLVGVLERVVLAIAVLWGLAAAVTVGLTHHAEPPRPADSTTSEGIDHR